MLSRRTYGWLLVIGLMSSLLGGGADLDADPGPSAVPVIARQPSALASAPPPAASADRAPRRVGEAVPRTRTPLGAEPSAQPEPGTDHADFLTAIEADRKTLFQGRASAQLYQSAHVGKPFPVTLSVCAPSASQCSVEESLGNGVAGEAAGGVLAGPAPLGARRKLGPVAIGGRVRARLTTYVSGIRITSNSDPVQLIAAPDDVGNWTWTVSATKPGRVSMLLEVTPLRAGTDETLTPPTKFWIAMDVSDTAGSRLSRWAGRVKDFLSSIGAFLTGVLTSLVTGLGVYLGYRLQRRSGRYEGPPTGDLQPDVAPEPPDVARVHRRPLRSRRSPARRRRRSPGR